jgi:DNA-binding CsgD family transcriptional regulator
VLAVRLAQTGDLPQAEAVLADTAREIKRAGHVPLGVAVRAARARIALLAGRTAEAGTEAQAALDAAERSGAIWFASWARTVLAVIALRRGEFADADQLIEGASQNAEAWVEVQSAAARLAPAEVLPLIRARRSELLLEPSAPGWMVRVATKAGDTELARTVVVAAQALAEANPGVPVLAAAAAHARGLLRQDADALAAAMDDLHDPWARASVAEDLAAVRAAAKADAREVVRALDTALAGYQSAGAIRDVARIRSRLRAAGVRRRHWSHAERPVSGWASLTDTERDVVELVVEGLTNRQVAARMFVSPHTVHAHLGRIFRKLQVNSRVELTGLRHRVA